MILTNFIRGLVQKHPELKLKLSKAMSKQTPFQYVYQTFTLTVMSVIAVFFLAYLIIDKSNLTQYLIGLSVVALSGPLLYRFWLSYIDVLIRKKEREIDGDLLFVSEYFLVSLESGLPLGNSIQNLAKIDRPGGRFFNKVYSEFNTGSDLEQALDNAIGYCPSENLKILLKRLKDSLNIGVDLRNILVNFIEESSEKKIVEIRGYSKKLSPIVMMYLILGVVLPSLGVTFFILAAALLDVGAEFLKYVLVFIFLLMFMIQYFSYSAFKFGKATL